jgi:hypothetical protein
MNFFLVQSCKPYYRLYKTSLLDLVLSQTNAVYILTLSFVLIIGVRNYMHINLLKPTGYMKHQQV